jgi:hypothetical protein
MRDERIAFFGCARVSRQAFTEAVMMSAARAIAKSLNRKSA